MSAYSFIPYVDLVEGEWIDDIQNYPNKDYDFISNENYECNIKRNQFWVYCGYVIVP